MKKMLFFAPIMAISLLSGCYHSSEKEIIEFPVFKTISFKEVKIPHIIAIPGEIVIQDDKIIVLDLETDWFFSVFSLEGYDFLGKILRRGRGPDEEVVISPHLRPFFENTILFQTTSAMKIGRIQTNKEGLVLEVIKKYDLPIEMYDDTDIFLLNGCLFSSISFRPSKKDFHGFCPETGKSFEWGESLPLNMARGLGSVVPIVLEKITTINPNNRLLATAYFDLPIVRIYCAESGSLISELRMGDSSMNEQILISDISDPAREGFIYHYHRIKSTKEYIYALYQGHSGVEFSFEGGVPKYQDVSSELHIWDWDGNPIMNLKFERAVFSFDVTPDNKQIIAFSIVDVDKLFVAEIPWD